MRIMLDYTIMFTYVLFLYRSYIVWTDEIVPATREHNVFYVIDNICLRNSGKW